MGKKGKRFKINFKNPFKRRRRRNFQPNPNNNLGIVLILILIIMGLGVFFIAPPVQQQLPGTPDKQQPIVASDMFTPFKDTYIQFTQFMF
jgi:hypothetical protein